MSKEPSELQTLQRKNSWAKCQIKAGTTQLLQAAQQLGLRSSERLALEKTVAKLETTMLNQLAENYESTKATILWERQTGKTLGVTKSG